MPISRLAILCCREAASASAPPEPPGHPLALFGDAQRRLYEDSPALARSTNIVIDVQGGGRMVLWRCMKRCALCCSAKEGGGHDDRGAAAEDEDLWPSILLIREIVVRLVLSMLRFEGIYQCYLGARHIRRFPDCKPVD